MSESTSQTLTLVGRFWLIPEDYFSTGILAAPGLLAMPHSKQRGFNRDVINPQDGHILCDWNPPVSAFLCTR
jgi:hypothetical protein